MKSAAVGGHVGQPLRMQSVENGMARLVRDDIKGPVSEDQLLGLVITRVEVVERQTASAAAVEGVALLSGPGVDRNRIGPPDPLEGLTVSNPTQCALIHGNDLPHHHKGMDSIELLRVLNRVEDEVSRLIAPNGLHPTDLDEIIFGSIRNARGEKGKAHSSCSAAGVLLPDTS